MACAASLFTGANFLADSSWGGFQIDKYSGGCKTLLCCTIRHKSVSFLTIEYVRKMNFPVSDSRRFIDKQINVQKSNRERD